MISSERNKWQASSNPAAEAASLADQELLSQALSNSLKHRAYYYYKLETPLSIHLVLIWLTKMHHFKPQQQPLQFRYELLWFDLISSSEKHKECSQMWCNMVAELSSDFLRFNWWLIVDLTSDRMARKWPITLVWPFDINRVDFSILSDLKWNYTTHLFKE